MVKFIFKSIALLVFTFLLIACSDKDDIVKPTASFTIPPFDNIAPASVSFSNSSKNCTDYIWDFGDGSLSIEYSPKHAYVTPGKYTVVLKVFGEGGKDTLARNITIKGSDNTYYQVANYSTNKVFNVRTFYLDWEESLLYNLVEHGDLAPDSITEPQVTIWPSVEVLFQYDEFYYMLAFPNPIIANSTTTITISDTSKVFSWDSDPLTAKALKEGKGRSINLSELKNR